MTPTELWKQLQESRDTRRLLMFAESFPGTIESYRARELAAALEEHTALAKELPPIDAQRCRQVSEDAASALAANESNLLDSASELEDLAFRHEELADKAAKLSHWSWPIQEWTRRTAAFLQRWPNHPDAAAMSAELDELRSHERITRQRLDQLSSAIGRIPLPAIAVPELVKIPPGRFIMGSAATDDEWEDEWDDPYDDLGMREGPPHEVQIDYAFEMAKFPVTFAQWDAARAVCPSLLEPDDCGWGRGDRPVVNVSWGDAQRFIGLLNEKLGLVGRSDRYRLPSEAEWEYACRAGSAALYSFGDDETLLDEFAWWSGNSAGRTHPVGQKRPNTFGLHDMHGLVFEWCADAWHANYDGAPTDGSAWMNVSGHWELVERVIRGGTWNNDPDPAWCNRSASRDGARESVRAPDISFRLVRTITRP